MSTQPRHYYKEVRLRQMRALVELARHGSFTKAARGLGLSSPAVWQQVRALEREFDADLVQARRGEAVLTDDGELLARLTAPLVESFDSVRAMFAERRGQLRRQLTLSTTTSLLTHELPGVIARYRETHPQIEFTLIDRPSVEACAIFERGGADLAIVGTAGAQPCAPHVHAETLLHYPFQLLCPAAHPLLLKKRLTLDDIARHPLILAGAGAAVSQQVQEVFARNDAREPRVALTSTNLGLTISYVHMGFGIAVVPVPSRILAKWRASEHGGVQTRDVSRLFGHEPILLLHRTSGHELAHVRQFREAVVKALGRMALE